MCLHLKHISLRLIINEFITINIVFYDALISLLGSSVSNGRLFRYSTVSLIITFKAYCLQRKTLLFFFCFFLLIIVIKVFLLQQKVLLIFFCFFFRLIIMTLTYNSYGSLLQLIGTGARCLTRESMKKWQIFRTF